VKQFEEKSFYFFATIEGIFIRKGHRGIDPCSILLVVPQNIEFEIIESEFIDDDFIE
jgi:hypothetical protein